MGSEPRALQSKLPIVGPPPRGTTFRRKQGHGRGGLDARHQRGKRICGEGRRSEIRTNLEQFPSIKASKAIRNEKSWGFSFPGGRSILVLSTETQCSDRPNLSQEAKESAECARLGPARGR